MKALGEGEGSHTYRVRAPAAVLNWWGSLTAEQRGDVLAQVMTWRDRSRPAVIAAYSGPVEGPVGAVEGQSAGVALLGRLEASEAQREVLALGVVPSNPNSLTPYLWRIVQAMRDGATLSRAQGETWRLSYPDGRGVSVRGDSVQGMLDRGVLTTFPRAADQPQGLSVDT